MTVAEQVVRSALAGYERRFEQAKDAFEKRWDSSPVYALEWDSSRVVAAQVELDWAKRVMECEEGLEEGLRHAVKYLTRQMTEAFRIPRSTSVFANAVEGFKIEAEARMLVVFGGLLETLVEAIEAEVASS